MCYTWELWRQLFLPTLLTFYVVIKPNYSDCKHFRSVSLFHRALLCYSNCQQRQNIHTYTHIHGILSKWRKIWAFYNKHIFQWMSFSQSNYFTSPKDYWLHHIEKPWKAYFIFPMYLWFLCKLRLVTMKNDKFAIWSKC